MKRVTGIINDKSDPDKMRRVTRIKNEKGAPDYKLKR